MPVAETLPWSWYADPGVLAREERAIFASSWHYAGHAGQVERPGDRFACSAGGVPVAVVRGDGGELRAFLNVCRHRGAEVVRESGNRRTLQCRYHAWTYGLDVSLLRAPRSKRESGFALEGLSLRPARVEALGPLLFVSVAEDAPPLAEVAAGVPAALAEDGIDLASLVFDRRVEFTLDANWKVVIENYLECYHCPTAHPDFSRAVDVDADSYRLETAGWSSSQYGHSRNGAGPVATAQFHFVWPLTRINVFPGPPNLSVGASWPLGPERTAGFFDYFFASGTSQEEIEELIAFDSQVGAEDRELVESVQRGVRSGLIESGRLLPESERLIAHFQALVRETLKA